MSRRLSGVSATGWVGGRVPVVGPPRASGLPRLCCNAYGFRNVPYPFIAEPQHVVGLWSVILTEPPDRLGKEVSEKMAGRSW